MPSHETSPDQSPYKDVLSEGNRNFQMFAYCPKVSQISCGISKSFDTDTSLFATDNELVVYSKEMKYRKGDTSTRQYDFCNYKLSRDLNTIDDERLQKIRAKSSNQKVFLNLKFTKLKEMNAYIYKGKTRYDSKEMLIDGNKQVEADKVYQVDVDESIFIISYPNYDKDTEFQFNYWIAPYIEPHEEPWYEFAGNMGENVFMILCGIAAVLLTCNLCVCCYCCFMNVKNCHARRVQAKID